MKLLFFSFSPDPVIISDFIYDGQRCSFLCPLCPVAVMKTLKKGKQGRIRHIPVAYFGMNKFDIFRFCFYGQICELNWQEIFTLENNTLSQALSGP
jgi:hypothetical protein